MKINSQAQERFWSHVVIMGEDDCWDWQLPTKRYPPPYPQFYYEGVRYSANRISWALANGAIPKGLWVLHHCDNTVCVNPNHLFLGTHKDNMADMKAKGRGKKGKIFLGEEHPMSKLTEDDVLEIRALGKTGNFSHAELGDMFSVHQVTVSKIVTRKSWTHI